MREPDPEVEKPVITVTAPAGETDLLGKRADELQTGVEISGDVVNGTVNYVEGYTDFNPSQPEQQAGNFLVIHVNATDSTKITCELSDSDSGKGAVQLDPDGLFVARLKANTQTITVVATGEGGSTTKVLKLTGLTLTPNAMAASMMSFETKETRSTKKK